MDEVRRWIKAVENLNALQKDKIKELKQRIAFLESTTNEVKPKKKKRRNNIGLQVIHGGKKSEEQPTFVNQTPPEAV